MEKLYAKQTAKILVMLCEICPKEPEAGKFATETVFTGIKRRCC
jgi:hypothetical protein